MRRERMMLVAVSGLALSIGTAFAQNQPAHAPAGNPPGNKQPSEDPKADETSKGKTIIERDADGKLKRIEITPEEAAIQIMDLDPAERERVNKILAERAAILDEIVMKNFNLLGKLHAAVQSGDQEAMSKAYAGFTPKLERLSDRGRLEDEIKPELRMDHAPEFQRLVAEYRQALLQDRIREVKAQGKEPAPQAIVNREMLIATGEQIRRAYNRTVGTKVAEFDSALSKLALKPEQETKIRGLAADFARKYTGKATPEQKRELVMQMLTEMETDQRVAFARLLNEAK